MKPIEILYVEDNEGDAELAREGFSLAKIANSLHIVADGVEALQFLRREPPFGDAPRPDLILLDLNLPRLDGHEVLREIKSDEDLRTIPVAVLTGSEAEADVVRSYEHHANCYIVKPVSLRGLAKVIEAIDMFWFSIVRLPNR